MKLFRFICVFILMIMCKPLFSENSSIPITIEAEVLNINSTIISKIDGDFYEGKVINYSPTYLVFKASCSGTTYPQIILLPPGKTKSFKFITPMKNSIKIICETGKKRFQIKTYKDFFKFK